MPNEKHLSGFICTRCGMCCTEEQFVGTMTATEADLEMWVAAERWDIINTASILQDDDGEILQIDLWFSPKTGDDLSRCPWVRKLPNLNKYICRIYDLRPEICRNYPVDREHRTETDCPGYWEDEVDEK